MMPPQKTFAKKKKSGHGVEMTGFKDDAWKKRLKNKGTV